MLKVIIADDEPLICRLVETLADWEALDMAVAGTAGNGLEALELTEKLRPDILITDIRMPGCDGLELIRRAKELAPELEVVIISGYAHFDYARSAIRYGVGNYLLKPIKQEELMGTLRKMKERCEARQARVNGQQRQQQDRLRDLDRLRAGLIRDLLSGNPPPFTDELLNASYHVRIRGDVCQIFLLKIDRRSREDAGAAVKIVEERAGEILEEEMKKCCKEFLLCFRKDAGYGLLNYDSEDRSRVRSGLREALNRLEAGRELFGSFAFSLALGSAAAGPEGLEESLKAARAALPERLVQGSGRLLEGAPAGGELPRRELLDRYRKSAEHALEAGEPEQLREAALRLEEEVLERERLCGRDLLDLTLSAGSLFVTLAAAGSAEELREDFSFRCGQCRNGKELFRELVQLQDTLMQEADKLRREETSRPIRVARQYVEKHYQEPLTLEEVCEAVGFSVSYFSALFKKETGEGFAKYLTRVRIEAAKQLLRETGLPVSEICEQVGYSDRKHFTHTFRKMAGLNPAEYRKLYG